MKKHVVGIELAALMDFQGLVPAERSLLSETLREREADVLYSVALRTLLIYILIDSTGHILNKVRKPTLAERGPEYALQLLFRKNDTPLGWLLTVLQKERAEKADMNEALIEAISHLRKLQETQPAQWREAIGYLLQIILHRRTPEEHRDLIQLVEQHSHDKEVNTMAQSMAEVLLEQGIQQGISAIGVSCGGLKQLNLDASLATSFRTFQEHLET